MLDHTSAEPTAICCAVRIGEDHVLPSTTVRDLGILIYSDVTCGLKCSVRCRVVSLCYDSSAASDAQCPTLCFIRCMVVSLVMPRLDYSNATLAGLSASQLRRLQSVLNAAVRLIHRSSGSEHVTQMLPDLHCCGLRQWRSQKFSTGGALITGFFLSP